jgi:hypothetical protein
VQCRMLIERRRGRGTGDGGRNFRSKVCEVDLQSLWGPDMKSAVHQVIPVLCCCVSLCILLCMSITLVLCYCVLLSVNITSVLDMFFTPSLYCTYCTYLPSHCPHCPRHTDTNSNSNSISNTVGTDSTDNTTNVESPTIPERLPGWAGPESYKLPPSPFPLDTTHTYGLSICTATSRGYSGDPVQVRRERR